MVPPAPATFSITIGSPSAAARGPASTRASASDGPPGGKGAMTVIGRVVYSCAAAAPIPIAGSAAANKSVFTAGLVTLRLLAAVSARDRPSPSGQHDRTSY